MGVAKGDGDDVAHSKPEVAASRGGGRDGEVSALLRRKMAKGGRGAETLKPKWLRRPQLLAFVCCLLQRCNSSLHMSDP